MNSLESLKAALHVMRALFPVGETLDEHVSQAGRAHEMHVGTADCNEPCRENYWKERASLLAPLTAYRREVAIPPPMEVNVL